MTSPLAESSLIIPRQDEGGASDAHKHRPTATEEVKGRVAYDIVSSNGDCGYGPDLSSEEEGSSYGMKGYKGDGGTYAKSLVGGQRERRGARYGRSVSFAEIQSPTRAHSLSEANSIGDTDSMGGDTNSIGGDSMIHHYHEGEVTPDKHVRFDWRPLTLSAATTAVGSFTSHGSQASDISSGVRCDSDNLEGMMIDVNSGIDSLSLSGESLQENHSEEDVVPMIDSEDSTQEDDNDYQVLKDVAVRKRRLTKRREVGVLPFPLASDVSSSSEDLSSLKKSYCTPDHDAHVLIRSHFPPSPTKDFLYPVASNCIRTHVRALLVNVLTYVAVFFFSPNLFSSSTEWASSKGGRSDAPQSPREFIEDHHHGFTLINVHLHEYFVNSVVFTAVLLFLAASYHIYLRWQSDEATIQQSRVYGFVCFSLTCVGVSGALFGGLDAKVPLVPDPTTFIAMVAHWVDMWSCGEVSLTALVLNVLLCVLLVAVDIYGLVVQVRVTRRNLKKRDSLVFLVPVSILMVVAYFFLTDIPGCTGSEGHWVDFDNLEDKTIQGRSEEHHALSAMFSPEWIRHKFHPFEIDTTGTYVQVSKYIPMNDGTRIAADVYLPPKLVDSILSMDSSSLASEEFRNYPTFIDVTRYNRRMTVMWPFTMIPLWGQKMGSTTNLWNWQAVEAMVPNGYVVIVADTRGSGASTGDRPVDFSPSEILDMPQVVEWVKQQFWSSGKVGMGGISYDGMTGLHAAALGGVDAVAALFTPMDVTNDLIQPGGLVCSSFVDDYAGLTQGFEKKGNPFTHFLSVWSYPIHIALGFFSTFGRPSPIESEERVVSDAIEQHSNNWNMSQLVQTVRYKDDTIELASGNLPVGRLGITEDVMAGLARNKVDVYIVGGYCDSSSARGASRLFDYLTERAPTTKPKLILGPWTHTGRRTCGNVNSGSYSCFESNMYYDIVRYMDCRLGIHCWGGVEAELDDERVHFYEMGADEWRSSLHFPPQDNMEYLDLKFSSDRVAYEGAPHGKENGERESNVHTPSSLVDWKHGNMYTKANEMSEALSGSANQWMNYMMQRWRGEEVEMTGSVEMSETPHSYRFRPSGLVSDNLFVSNVTQSSPSIASGAHTRDIDEHTGTFPSVASASSDSLTYPIDYTSTSGIYTRWLVAKHPFRVKVDYTNRYEEGRRGLTFTTDVLSDDAAMVGSCVLEFAVDLEGSYDTQIQDVNNGRPLLRDVPVFAYVEDVDLATGIVTYVTEGRSLLSHRSRKQSEDVAVGAANAIEQPGTSKFHKYASGSETEHIMLTTEPVAYRFAKGHAIRLTLTGADVDNFKWEDTTLKIYDDNHVYHNAKASTSTSAANSTSTLEAKSGGDHPRVYHHEKEDVCSLTVMEQKQRRLASAVFAHSKKVSLLAHAQVSVKATMKYIHHFPKSKYLQNKDTCPLKTFQDYANESAKRARRSKCSKALESSVESAATSSASRHPHLGHTTTGISITRPSRWRILVTEESRIKLPLRVSK